MEDPEKIVEDAKKVLADGVDHMAFTIATMTGLTGDQQMKSQMSSWANSLRDIASRLRTGELADGDSVLTVAALMSNYLNGLPGLTAVMQMIQRGMIEMHESKIRFNDQLRDIMEGLG